MKILILGGGQDAFILSYLFFKKYNIRTSIAVRNLSNNSISNWAKVFECGSFRWLGDLVVVVVKVESSSVASNLSQKTTFKINAGLSSFTFPKFQGKNRSAAER